MFPTYSGKYTISALQKYLLKINYPSVIRFHSINKVDERNLEVLKIRFIMSLIRLNVLFMLNIVYELRPKNKSFKMIANEDRKLYKDYYFC